MKKQIVAVLLMCSVACVAETVSYSIPVLTVKSERIPPQPQILHA